MPPINKSGKMIVVSAPSGAGKTTIVRHLLSIEDLGLEFSVSACSRRRRKNEVDGRDYFFLSIEEFKRKISEDDFIEWEEVYQDHYYGTLKSEVERIWKNNRSVIFDVDVIGGLNIKKKYPDQTLALFIMPPSFEVLEHRLINRSTESSDSIQTRIMKAKKELTYAPQFDQQIINSHLPTALMQVELAVRGYLSKI